MRIPPPSKPSSTLSYDALVDFWGEFDPYEMNTLLAGGEMMVKLLKLDELQDANAGLNSRGPESWSPPWGPSCCAAEPCPPTP